MTITAGIDVGSSYTKAVLANEQGEIIAHDMSPTGFRLGVVSQRVFDNCLAAAKLTRAEVDYVDSLQGSGFSIKNPQAKTTCGCGSSFSA